MQMISLIWGILAILGMLVGLIPCLGALNWLNIPFAGIGLIVGALAYGTSSSIDNRGGSRAGITCCAIALFVGIIRLIVGLGVL